MKCRSLTSPGASVVSRADVVACLRYEPETGKFFRVADAGRWKAGAEVGTSGRGGYRFVIVNGERLLAHRVAWLLVHGEWPDGEIDHINGSPWDNRLCNLRVVDRVTNTQNRRRPQSNNRSSGILGVTWNKKAGKWQAQIKVGDRVKYLGIFKEACDAGAAYLTAKRAMHAGCTI